MNIFIDSLNELKKTIELFDKTHDTVIVDDSLLKAFNYLNDRDVQAHFQWAMLSRFLNSGPSTTCD